MVGNGWERGGRGIRKENGEVERRRRKEKGRGGGGGELKEGRRHARRTFHQIAVTRQLQNPADTHTP